MTDRSKFRVFARRLHYGLRRAIEDGDGRVDSEWVHVERPHFEHYTCGMYLIGSLAYLEGKYGETSWTRPSSMYADIDDFIANLSDPIRRKFRSFGVSRAGLDALVCIRNAITHNENDLSGNRDRSSVHKVRNASIVGVTLNGSVVTLSSNRTADFMEYVRKSFVAVSMYHGDG